MKDLNFDRRALSEKDAAQYIDIVNDFYLSFPILG